MAGVLTREKEKLMTNKLAVTINSTPVEIKEYQGQRVVTLKEIDQVHQRPDGTAKRNFMANKEHFIEGVDFFTASANQKNEFRTLEIPNRGLTLITESGYLMLVKSFTDDLAWTVQRQLVNTYFRATADKPKEAKPKHIPLSSANNTAKIIMQAMSEAGVDPNFKVLTLHGIYEPFGISIPLQALPAMDKLYDLTAIARELGVTSKAGKPHSQAIGAIVSKVNVRESEVKVVPFMNNGHSGTTEQYTEAVLDRVRRWIAENDYPKAVTGANGQQYKVAYN